MHNLRIPLVGTAAVSSVLVAILLPNESWATVITAVLLVGGLLSFFSDRLQNALRHLFTRRPGAISGIPVALFCLYAFYALGNGAWDTNQALKIGIFFAAPTLLVCLASRYGSNRSMLDMCAVLAVWLPFDFRVLGRSDGNDREFDYYLGSAAATILAMTLFVCVREFCDANVCCKGSLRDAWYTAAALGLSACTLIPLGIIWDFMRIKPGLFSELGTVAMLGVIAERTFSMSFLLAIAGKSLVIALPEEFLFRGIIQNYLKNILANTWLAVGVTSLIFGAAHLNNGACSWHVADWNWAYAGLAAIAGGGYGWVFLKTRSILFPIVLHGTVDAVCHTFFQVVYAVRSCAA